MTGDLPPTQGRTPEVSSKITPGHLSRSALVYVRQSTPEQVERNKESQRLQYGLVDRATELGWPKERVQVID